MSILIVDDNPVNLIIIEKILKSEGYRDCITASSAHELYKLLGIVSGEPAEMPVDLILMDMMMPEIDGLAACRRIHQEERLRDIPIIIVTALGDSNKLAEALDAGAMDYVMKPINKVELMARIRVALRLKYEKDWHIERDRRIRNELDLAKQVQRSVLGQPVDNEIIRITANYYPSFELAGDMYSWYRIDDHRYGVILLDMMGHGISSSLVCMFISSVLQDTITRLVDPELVINELNRYMNQLYSLEHFIHYYFTAIYLVIDTHRKTIEYVNAGHPPGLVVYKDGSSVQLDKGSCAVGFFEQIEIQKDRIEYCDNARIFLFTDGLLEAVEKQGGDLHTQLTSAVTGDLAEAMDRILPEEDRGNQQDDMCMVLIETV
ncbi:SpoIIE family protein phosphatase [Gorillibacterium massiliense]|uniref:SpoIIE family protein phosphatase n=1 Tax=Gorillibacterium massiliense TaxID=1280390 RepID=UPI0004B43847|nr:fused response regulator/phosphatase [Gorillibacterium massiliense]